MTTTISEQVRAMRDGAAHQPPREAMQTFAREVEELARGGAPAGVAVAGAVIEDVELVDVHGQPATLFAAIGDGPAVLVFYRGAWCPYCNIALRTYQSELVPELSRRGVALVAVSPQSPDGSLSVQERHQLDYAVLSDPGNRLAGALGILTAPSEASLAAQRELGLDLRKVNADATVTIPMPTTVLVDGSRTVRWIDVHPDYTTRSEPDEILDAVDGANL